MLEQKNMRLCGGTFLALLLEARGTLQNSRNREGGSSYSKSESEVFKDLVRTVNPGYSPLQGGSLKPWTSNYKMCKSNASDTLGLNKTQYIAQFDEAIKGQYVECLTSFQQSLSKTINSDVDGRWLIAALLDLINADTTIPNDASFYVLPNGNTVTKSELGKIKPICIPSFILGVWHYIITKVNDNRVGRNTIKRLFENSSSTHNKLKFTSEIGQETSKNIETYFPPLFENVDSKGHSEPSETSPQLISAAEPQEKEKFFELSPALLLYASQTYNTYASCSDQDFTFIDLNTAPEQFVLKKSAKRIYKLQTECSIDARFAPDGTCKVQVSFIINETTLLGYTSYDNWVTPSTVDTLDSDGICECIVWFYILNSNSTSPRIKFLVIGNTNEE